MFENIDVSPLTRETSVWMKWEGTTETFFFVPLDNFLCLGLFSGITVSSIALCIVPLLECTSSIKAARGKMVYMRNPKVDKNACYYQLKTIEH